jgi:hypothetical protein
VICMCMCALAVVSPQGGLSGRHVHLAMPGIVVSAYAMHGHLAWAVAGLNVGAALSCRLCRHASNCMAGSCCSCSQHACTRLLRAEQLPDCCAVHGSFAAASAAFR